MENQIQKIKKENNKLASKKLESHSRTVQSVLDQDGRKGGNVLVTGTEHTKGQISVAKKLGTSGSYLLCDWGC